MLMPWVSVSAIGLLVGLVGAVRGNARLKSLTGGFAGAWLGFAVGALAGLTFDVWAQTGTTLAMAGHVGAAAAATTAVLLGGHDAQEPSADPV